MDPLIQDQQVGLLLFSRFPWPLSFECLHLHELPLRVCHCPHKQLKLSQQSFAEPRPTLVAVGLERTRSWSSHAETRMQRWHLLLQPTGLVQRESSLLQCSRRWIVPWVPPGWEEEWRRKWPKILSSHNSCCCPPSDLRETQSYPIFWTKPWPWKQWFPWSPKLDTFTIFFCASQKNSGEGCVKLYICVSAYCLKLYWILSNRAGNFEK